MSRHEAQHPFRAKRQKPGKFNPDQEYINRAVEEYKKQGGRVTVIDVDWDAPVPYGRTDYADSFLMGQ